MIIPDAATKKALFIIDVQPLTLKGSTASAIVKKIESYIKKIPYDAYVLAEYHAPKTSMLYQQGDWTLSEEETGKTDKNIQETLAPYNENLFHVNKTTRSCFKGEHSDQLHIFLKERGIEEFHFLGFDINDCVLASAYDAIDLGYYSFVLEELSHHNSGITKLVDSTLTILHRQHMTNNSLHTKIGFKTIELTPKPLKGIKAIVTSGPTFEPIDPVRFIGNKSSGKQGHAIATALIQAGAQVEYVTGPTNLPPPQGAHTTTIDSAQEMINTVESCLPADIFIGVAAVCDWRSAEQHAQKMKKGDHASPPTLSLIENPDILQNVATHKKRPKLVIGFAAETQNLKENARAKLERKKCDWIVGNTVSGEETAFGSDENQVCVLKYTQDRQDITLDEWARMSKTDIAHKLVDMITEEKGIRD